MKNLKPVVCTLTPAQFVHRGSAWRTIVQTTTRAQECPGGYVLTFDRDERRLAKLVELVASEQACCEWMNLDLVQGDEVTLTMTADSVEGAAVIQAMLGVKDSGPGP